SRRLRGYTPIGKSDPPHPNPLPCGKREYRRAAMRVRAHAEEHLVRLLADRRDAAAAAILRNRRQAPDARLGALPGHRPLRRVAMPRLRIEVAQFLVLHLIELDV